MRTLTDEIPSLKEMVSYINRIGELRTRALASLLYLTGARISEVVMYVRKNHIIRKTENVDGKDREIAVVQLKNLKNKSRRIKKQPIPLDRDVEREVYTHVDSYIKDMDEEEVLFPITRVRAFLLLKKELGIFPHLLRHFRLSHLVIYYDFNDQQLVSFAGWTDSRPAKHYMHFRLIDLLRKL